jgi:hypothetical protein
VLHAAVGTRAAVADQPAAAGAESTPPASPGAAAAHCQGWFITLQREEADMIEARPRADMIDPSDQAEPIENALANEPIDPTDSADPIEAIDSTDPLEPIDSSESSDHSDHFEVPVGSAMPGF